MKYSSTVNPSRKFERIGFSMMSPDGLAITGLGRVAETQLLELVEHGDGFFVAADFVTLPNKVTELLLAGVAVEEAHLFGPNFAEKDAPDCGLNDFLGRVPELGFLAEIR